MRQAVAELALTNVVPIAIDFDDFRADALFDTVVSRAVAKPAPLWRVAVELLSEGGLALLQVGESELEPVNVEADAQSVSVHIPGLSRTHYVLRMHRRSAA